MRLASGNAARHGTSRSRTGRLGRTSRISLTVLLLAMGVAGGMVPRANAQTQMRDFAIAAQPLSSALLQFSAASGLEIFFDQSLISGRTSPGLSGGHAIDAALGQLLAGTGLSFRYTNASTVTVYDPAASSDASYDGSIVLEEVNVAAWVEGAASGSGFMGTPDWVYETPGSLSVVGREAIVSANARDARDLLANVAGAYVNAANSTYPSISPNLRGLQDMGRVVVSVDGARQNVSQTVASGSSDTYQGGSSHAYVDSAFIRAIEVEKASGSGSGSAGSLGGSVNFRTVSASDLIAEGNSTGVEINATTGTNNHHFQGSILAAAQLTDTPFSVVAGLSGLNLGEYRLGSDGSVVWDGAAGQETHLMGRENISGLLKLEGDFGDLQTALTWTHQVKDFAYSIGSDAAMQSMSATTDTLTGKIDYAPQDNDLVDLHVNAWLNNTLTNQLRHERVNSLGTVTAPDTYIDSELTSFGGSIDNTSRFETAVGPLELNYGAEAFRDDGTVAATSSTIADNPSWASNYEAFSPPGMRDVASLYANASLQPADWVKLTGGLRYDWYRLQGSPTYYYREVIATGSNRPATSETTYLAYLLEYNVATYDRVRGICDTGMYNGNAVSVSARASSCTNVNTTWPNRRGEIISGTFYDAGTIIYGTTYQTVYPETTLDIDRTGAALLPSAMVEFTPVEWFKPFIRYSQSQRPPTISEAFFAGGSPGDGSPGTNYAPYADLQAETASTWEAGVNVSLDGLFSSSDSLRFKAVAFDRTVENYIVVAYHYLEGSPQQYLGYLNLIDPTHMRGVELEGSYDAGSFWVGGSATWLETEWGQRVATTSNGSATSDGQVFLWSGDVPPKFKLTIDAGVRLLEDKLTIGAQVTHVTPTLTQSQTFSEDGTYVTEEYTTLDLNASYKLSEQATLGLSIDNVMDVNYVPAGSRYPGPGRTILGSLQVKF